MRWQSGRRSENVEDRRGMRPATGAGLGLGAILVIGVITYLLGGDPAQVVQVIEEANEGTPSAAQESGPRGAPKDQMGDFASVILADTEDVWTGLLSQVGRRYEPPTLVIFEDAVGSACGLSSAAVGPFYCPRDRKLYLDLTFFQELSQRFGAPGDFAQAYVIAHEVGHHVQELLGISDEVQGRRGRVGREEANELSVRMELQADCLSGVWAHHAHAQRQLLEPGDVEEGLAAAAAIGDDTLQKRSGGRVQPESWTHGSSAMRVRWFRRGFEGGDVAACDTFADVQL